VTWWFPRSSATRPVAFGDTRTRQLYAVHRARQWRPPEAFELLVDAYKHESTARRGGKRAPWTPTHEMAEKIERALLAALRG
jgi:hypothetical protein